MARVRARVQGEDVRARAQGEDVRARARVRVSKANLQGEFLFLFNFCIFIEFQIEYSR